MREILDELRHLDVTPPALRRFGRTIGLVLLALGGLALSRRGGALAPLPAVLFAAGAALALVGLAAPRALRGVYRAWMGLAFALGFVMTRALLTVVFFGLVTPLGLVRRALGHDPLARRPAPDAPTFWRPKPPEDAAPARMEHTF